MGMFDTISSEQVKCFYKPMVTIKETINFYYSGGSLKSFEIGDDVPYQTPYYNYGSNFIIFDFHNAGIGIAKAIVIADGKVSSIFDYDKIPNTIDVGLVVDKYGNPLKINSASDFEKVVKDYVAAEETFDDLLREAANKKLFKLETEDTTENIIERLRNLAFGDFYKTWNIGIDDDRYKKVHDTTNIGAIVNHIVEKPEDAEEIIDIFQATYPQKQQAISEYNNWLQTNNIMQYNDIIKKLGGI